MIQFKHLEHLLHLINGLSGIGLLIEDNVGADWYIDKEYYRRIRIMWNTGNWATHIYWASDFEVISESR